MTSILYTDESMSLDTEVFDEKQMHRNARRLQTETNNVLDCMASVEELTDVAAKDPTSTDAWNTRVRHEQRLERMARDMHIYPNRLVGSADKAMDAHKMKGVQNSAKYLVCEIGYLVDCFADVKKHTAAAAQEPTDQSTADKLSKSKEWFAVVERSVLSRVARLIDEVAGAEDEMSDGDDDIPDSNAGEEPKKTVAADIPGSESGDPVFNYLMSLRAGGHYQHSDGDDDEDEGDEGDDGDEQPDEDEIEQDDDSEGDDDEDQEDEGPDKKRLKLK